jgi:hypothetical protein
LLVHFDLLLLTLGYVVYRVRFSDLANPFVDLQHYRISPAELIERLIKRFRLLLAGLHLFFVNAFLLSPKVIVFG